MNQYTNISIKDKERYVLISYESPSKAYETYCNEYGQTQTFNSFRISLRRWSKALKKKNQLSLNAYHSVSNIINDITPLQMEVQVTTRGDTYLEIPLFDSHFGISDFNYYLGALNGIVSHIVKGHKEVLLIVGQDLFHADNLRGNTAHGTHVSDHFEDWWFEDAWRFYTFIINVAIKHSHKVKVVYSKGNHDETVAWLFVKSLEKYYSEVSNIEFDTTLDAIKYTMLGENFIGITHGDKTPFQQLDRIFTGVYRKEIANSKYAEIHTGHFHHEKAQDRYGLPVRTLATLNKKDHYHMEHGYNAIERFMLFTWFEDGLKSIEYIYTKQLDNS